jgi:hypothetical protein
MRSDRIDDRVGEHLVSRDASRLDFHGIHEGDVLVDADRFDPRPSAGRMGAMLSKQHRRSPGRCGCHQIFPSPSGG